MGASSNVPPDRSRFLPLNLKYRAGVHFVGGIFAGGVICMVVLRLSGLAVVSQVELDKQAQMVTDLQIENHELTDDLFNYQGPDAAFDPADPPYDELADAHAVVADARQQAVQADKILMVTFGANWCMDCRMLYRHLKTDDVMAYTDGLFQFANVDVGKFNRNRDLAEELGVDLARGIPVAIFFDVAGNKIGTTNDGELETSRYYSSKQILKFVRNIAEKSVITAPDSVQ